MSRQKWHSVKTMWHYVKKFFLKYWIFFWLVFKLTELACKLYTFYYFQPKNLTWIFKFHSDSNFILLLISFETTCYFQNKAIFWIVFNWSADWYFRSANYAQFYCLLLKSFLVIQISFILSARIFHLKWLTDFQTERFPD